jgi:hypothetical protein
MNTKKRFIYYCSPEHWLQASLELNESALDLYRLRNESRFIQNIDPGKQSILSRPGPSRAIYLLMAYSLENLLKGVSVLRDSALVNSGKIDGKIKTHNLNKLSTTLGFNLSDAQKHLQDLLSDQCVSNARYPVGRNENLQLDNPTLQEKDFELYRNLFKKYKLILVDEFHENGWDSGIDDETLNTVPKEFNYVEMSK